MAWRIQVTLESAVQTDFVFGFSTVALISFLELWLGLIVACMPTLAPLSNKYIKPHVSRITRGRSKQSDDSHQLRPVRGGMSNYSHLQSTPPSRAEKKWVSETSDEENFVGEDGTKFHSALWRNDPRGIWMKQSIQVDINSARH